MKDKEIIEKVVNAYRRFEPYVKDTNAISLTVTSEFFEALEVAMHALEDIKEISEALSSITEHEGSAYGYETACDKADMWCKGGDV